MLRATKKLQKTDLYNEYKSLEDFYYKTSLQKEHNQINYMSKNIFVKEKTGECFNLNVNYENSYKKYSKAIEQKIYCIEELAKEKKLVPIFITITCPTNYQPFISIERNGKRLYIEINDKFSFKKIKNAISEAYKFLNKIFRVFYKRIKNISKNLFYIKVFEPHKTFIPHLHILFYVENKPVIKKLKKV